MAYAALQKIDHNEEITQTTQPEFWYHLQLTLLAALQEQGMLTFTACRRAEEKLYLQHHGRMIP